MLAHFIMALCIYLGVYGAMHAYFFFKLIRAFPALRGLKTWAIPLSLLMMQFPFPAHMAEGLAPDALIRILHNVGFFWMGFLFLFCCLALLLDALAVAITLARNFSAEKLLPLVPARRSLALVSLAASLIFSLYALGEAAFVRVEHITLRAPKLPPGVNQLRLVHVTDLHIGAVMGGKRLERALARIAEQKPDLILATGDILDSRLGIRESNRKMLDALVARYGKFAVTGNHEFYVGPDRAVAFFESAGFRTLRDETVRVADILTLVGVDDPGHGITEHSRDAAETAMLRAVPWEELTILLKHRPEFGPVSAGLFDLQLSGHVHGGQVVPFNHLVRLVYPARMGLTSVAGGHLYVSRGGGTWGPPMRLFVPPEITVIELTRP